MVLQSTNLQRACLSGIKASIAFIDKNGGGPGVRLRERPQKKGKEVRIDLDQLFKRCG